MKGTELRSVRQRGWVRQFLVVDAGGHSAALAAAPVEAFLSALAHRGATGCGTRTNARGRGLWHPVATRWIEDGYDIRRVRELPTRRASAAPRHTAGTRVLSLQAEINAAAA